jgi:hypothetical protein
LSDALAAVKLLLDITGLAEEVLGKPLATDSSERRGRCEALARQLAAALADSAAMRRQLNNFAPLLIQALDRALDCRRWNEKQAADWDSLVGLLLPKVRQDAAAALAAASGEGGS